MSRHFAFAMTLAVTAISSGCKDWTTERDRIPKEVSVEAVTVKRAMGSNWGVRVRIDNKTTEDFTLQELSDKEAYVESNDGGESTLHELSVARAKSFTVGGMSQRTTEMLFVGTPEPPTRMHLKGRVIPLPAPPATLDSQGH